MVLPLINALLRIDPNLRDASSALGAGAVAHVLPVTLPLSLPGIIAGCLLTYAAAITAFITQSLVGGGQMLFMPMYLYQQASTLQNWPFAAAISIIFLVAVLLCVAAVQRAGPHSRAATPTPEPGWRVDAARRLEAVELQLVDVGAGAGSLLLAAGRADRWSCSSSRSPRASRCKFPPPGYSLRWYRRAARRLATALRRMEQRQGRCRTTLLSVVLGVAGGARDRTLADCRRHACSTACSCRRWCCRHWPSDLPR